MKIAYKTEIDPRPEQKTIIHQTTGCCRLVTNIFIEENQNRYKQGLPYLNNYDFSKWFNNHLVKGHKEFAFFKEVSSKAIRKAIDDAHRAYSKFMKGKGGFPHWKKKGKDDCGFYFVDSNKKTKHPSVRITNRSITVPTLGRIRLKEHGYIPRIDTEHEFLSGTITQKNGRYYISVLMEVPEPEKPQLRPIGFGIDPGIKLLAILSDGTIFENINKSKRIRKLKKQLRRALRTFSRRLEAARALEKEGGHPTWKNVLKAKQKVQKLYERIQNIRVDYENKAVAEIVKAKPSFVTVEDLNIQGLLKNHHLAGAISEQRWYSFTEKLKRKCRLLGIEFRKVDRFYPSSKTCSKCQNIKHDLKLNDRIYKCNVCGMEMDRDLNAAVNLRDCKTYKVENS